MSPNFIPLTLLITLFSCTKSDIRRNACMDGATGLLPEAGCSGFVPNLFTPNGDGLNDEFPMGFGCVSVDTFHFSIYKGEQILHESSNSQDFVWNGTSNGKDIKEGVYYWKMSLTHNGQDIEISNTITLIRDKSEPIKINAEASCFYLFNEKIEFEKF